MKTSYDYLKALCLVRDSSSAARKPLPLSNRGRFITDCLERTGVKPNLHQFHDNALNSDLTNISVSIGGYEKSRVFVAHYDTLLFNGCSDNANDNSSSVSILLEFVDSLSASNLERTIHVVFTDAEEYSSLGAKHLGQQIKTGLYGEVDWVCNLELCGLGTQLFVDDVDNSLQSRILLWENVISLPTPQNDSVFLRRLGITSSCIGLIPEDEVKSVKQYGYCAHWEHCHRRSDSIARISSRDMKRVSDFIMDLATE